MKRFLTVLMIMVMIPYVTTMAWTGRIGGGDFTGFEELAGAGGEGSQGGSLGTDGNGVAGRRYVAVEREGKVSRVPAEDFLVHVLAAQIPADFGPETLKAQAVIARTYIYREMDGAEEIPEEALDMDALSGAQMEELWGGTYQEDYSRIREAVSATSGLYLAYEGEPAEVFFCRAASGATGAGYVVQIQIGPKTYSGEEVQYALGLSSPCFYFDELQGKIRVTCKGIGHGYGFSQAGASALEKEGLGFEALLDHYFQNVEILKEGI